jgi:DNA-binding Xre family transcriptional regulator/site-specific recombinase XerD
MQVRWRLRMAAAQREVWTGAQLRRLLAERAGLQLSSASVSALLTKQPAQVKLETLAALCTALECTPNDLLEVDTTLSSASPSPPVSPPSRRRWPGAARCRRSEGEVESGMRPSGNCTDCGTVTELHARGRCRRCYGAHRRRLGTRSCAGCASPGPPGLPPTVVTAASSAAIHARAAPQPCGSAGTAASCAPSRSGSLRPLLPAGPGPSPRLRPAPGRSADRPALLAWRLRCVLDPAALQRPRGHAVATPRPAAGEHPRTVTDGGAPGRRRRRSGRPAAAPRAGGLWGPGRSAAAQRPGRLDRQSPANAAPARDPEPFGALAARFNTAQQADQQRARRAGTKPRAERTLEINLIAIQDPARFLAARRPEIGGWEQVSVGDVEAFLATLRPSHRARQLAGLRAFFRHARTAKAILADPTRDLRANSNLAFAGRVLTVGQQRALYHRWTAQAARLHPGEPVAGLLLLLHGASVAEPHHLRTDDLDLGAGQVRMPGRPYPTPLDPATQTALQRLLTHRATQPGSSQYLLVNRHTGVSGQPVRTGWLERLLKPAGVSPQLLRVTRLAHLVTTTDPVLVAAAFGVRRNAPAHYLADHVDRARLPNL